MSTSSKTDRLSNRIPRDRYHSEIPFSGDRYPNQKRHLDDLHNTISKYQSLALMASDLPP